MKYRCIRTSQTRTESIVTEEEMREIIAIHYFAEDVEETLQSISKTLPLVLVVPMEEEAEIQAMYTPAEERSEVRGDSH